MEAPGSVARTIRCHACQQVVDLSECEAFTQVQCPYCQAVLVVPVEFGNFLLLSVQGAGGMGTVYRAMDLALGRLVALKVLKTKLAADPELIANFSREARAAAAVNHPNVAQIYSFGEQQNHYYIAMELLEQGSLDDRITQQTKLDEESVLNLGLQTAAGLRAAHESGLLHRDVKPGNVLFNDEGVPKIVDFGLARQHDAASEQTAGQPIWGTPYYIAPEKLLGHADDLRSDIYSLGATLFHALAGRPPFEAATATDVAVKHTTQPVISLKTFVPGVQDRTAQCIGRMLAKNPLERYASYDEVIGDLESALQVLKKQQAQGTVVVTETGEQVSMGSLITTLVVVAVGIALLVLVWFNRHRFGFGTTPRSSTTVQVTPTGSPTPNADAEVSFKIEMPWGRLWHAAADQAAKGQVDQAMQTYESLRPMLEKLPNHRQWLDYYEGLVLLSAERAADAAACFARATNQLKRIDNPQVTTTNFIPVLAAAMLDTVSLAEVEKTARRMPFWAEGLVYFSAGYKYLASGDLPRAGGMFQTYERTLSSEQRRWVFALQPLAGKLGAEIVTAMRTLNETARLHNAGQIETAIATNQAVLATVTLTAVKDKLRERGQALEKQLETTREQEQAANAAAVAAAQRDREREDRDRAVTEMRAMQAAETAAKPLWEAFDFKPAAAAFTDATNQVASAERRAALLGRAADMNLLAEFKDQLRASIARKPFEGALDIRDDTPVTGRLVRASEKELVFALAHGEFATTWRKLAPAGWRKLGEYYASAFAASDPPEQIARRYLLLAVFSKQFALDPAIINADADKAATLHPPLRAELDRLLKPAAKSP